MNATLDAATLARLGGEFAEAFNREDLDGAMAFFSDDVVYETFDGKRPQGLAAVRKEFAPQFRRRYGRLYFAQDAIHVDASAQTVVMTWVCEHRPEAGQEFANRLLPSAVRVLFGKNGGGWRGLDILTFRGKKICRKQTYAQAPLPLLRKL